MQNSFDAIVLAGYDPDHPDPITQLTGEPHKALVPVAGKPMIQYVVDALVESGAIERIVVAGADALDLDAGPCEVHFLPNLDSLFNNAFQAFELVGSWQSQDRHAMLAVADAPLLTGDMVRWFLEACSPYDKDTYMGIVERQVMETTFPGSRRTYLNLVEGQFCNGELYLTRISGALRRQEFIRELIEERKNVVRQVRMVGIGFLLKFLLRRLTIEDFLDVARRNLQLESSAVILPFAESGMDVDKPYQLEQVEAYLQRKTTQAGASD